MGNLLKLIFFLGRSTEATRFSKVSVLFLVISGVIAGLASTGLIALINNSLRPGDEMEAWVTPAFIGLCVALPLARFLSQLLLARLTQGITLDLRLRLSRQVLSAPLRQLEKIGPSRLLATLTNDVGTITGALSNVPLLFLHSTVVVSCLVYLAWLSWQLFLIVLGAVVLGMLSYQLPVHWAQRHFRAGREYWDDLLSHFRGMAEGTKELKVHRQRRHSFMDNLVEPAAEKLRYHSVFGATIYAVANSWGQILFFIIIGLILFVLPGWVTLEPEVITGYVLVILYMVTPLDTILNLLPQLSQAVVGVNKVEKLGLSLTEVSRDDGGAPLNGEWQELRLQGVTHTFYREDKDDTFTLGPIDLEIRRGELVFLVGGNGSGKTTLAKMLMGLYPPESGTLYLDGVEVEEVNRDSFRQLFSVVFSDFFLFDIFLGIEAADLDARAREYLKRLQLAHKVEMKDGALSTLELSQGQRKRLALLTAYLEDRPIYLFDEWASDQDPYFKEIFYRELVPDLLRRGKTVILISHDDQYYDTAERVVKLVYGQVVYDGDLSGYLATGGRPGDEIENRPHLAASTQEPVGE